MWSFQVLQKQRFLQKQTLGLWEITGLFTLDFYLHKGKSVFKKILEQTFLSSRFGKSKIVPIKATDSKM